MSKKKTREQILAEYAPKRYKLEIERKQLASYKAQKRTGSPPKARWFPTYMELSSTDS